MRELEVIKNILLNQINTLEEQRKVYFDYHLNGSGFGIYFGCVNVASSIHAIDKTIYRYQKYINLIDEYFMIYKNNILLKEDNTLLNTLLGKKEIRNLIREYASKIDINEERNKHINGKINLEDLEQSEVLNELNFKGKVKKI